MSDLIIIGAGPGGYKAALHAAQHGLQVTIFEQQHVGGTCLNVGCIPTKTYVHSASFDEAVERQPQVVEQLRSGVETLLSHPNITLVRERASFVDARTVETPGGQRYTADNIIIATGSSTKYIPVEGVNDPCVVDSTGLLALKERPRRLCIIGAGVIGMEFASVFNRFGSEVTVVEFLKECLPAIDSDIAKRLRKVMEKQGIKFNMQCGVKRIANGTVFFTNKKGQEESVEADVVLMATGRKPNTEGLNLEALGITLERNGAIPVDEHFEMKIIRNEENKKDDAPASSNSLNFTFPNSPHIYAIGDVNGRQMLAHAAEFQGHHVVNRILGLEDNIRFDVMPAAIFTTPEAASVGPCEDQLKEAGTPFECHKAFYRANGKALSMNETEGMVKLCCEPDEGRLLSCHAYGAHAADLVQEATAYITLGATLRQLRETVHIHPTLSEILIEVN
ncbi:MAG: NAD(P)/FAD-dependent oxidoreductase [Bacteroidaceae bacterium]|nr:NAD(P)/FAD-dependent oxidoreductase [Bacteroidaceae bacterium]